VLVSRSQEIPNALHYNPQSDDNARENGTEFPMKVNSPEMACTSCRNPPPGRSPRPPGRWGDGGQASQTRLEGSTTAFTVSFTHGVMLACFCSGLAPNIGRAEPPRPERAGYALEMV